MDIESSIYIKRMVAEIEDTSLGDALSKRYNLERILEVLEKEIQNNSCMDCGKKIGDGASRRCYECRVKCGEM